jgi:predicted unusual protein kinase regulating ubiquinone biosynthesis (AarF/ABC1/UbiB family)
LDWGLVTEVPSNTQIKFIEHVAHLTSKDYEEVPADLVALGFVPQGSEEAILRTECVQVLTEVRVRVRGIVVS